MDGSEAATSEQSGKRSDMPDGTVLRIGGRMGLRDAKGLLTRLSEAMAEPGNLTIDARTLTDVDISIVQLLISAGKSTELNDRDITFLTEPSGALDATLVQAGFQAMTGDGRFWVASADTQKGTGA